jgi:hypothetical protein
MSWGNAAQQGGGDTSHAQNVTRIFFATFCFAAPFATTAQSQDLSTGPPSSSAETAPTSSTIEHLISYGHWIGSTVLFRPEIRLEHSYDSAAYNLGTKKTQFVVADDLTYHF